MKGCFGTFQNDRTCAYCCSSTPNLYTECRQMNAEVQEVEKVKRLEKEAHLEHCPYREWYLDYEDRCEDWICTLTKQWCNEGYSSKKLCEYMKNIRSIKSWLV